MSVRAAWLLLALIYVATAALQLRGERSGARSEHTPWLQILQCDRCGGSQCNQQIVKADGTTCYPCMSGYHCQYLFAGNNEVTITLHSHNSCAGFGSNQQVQLNVCFVDSGIEYTKYGPEPPMK
jgi:hypothetical protein